MCRRIFTAGFALIVLGLLALTSRAQSSERVVKAQGYLSVDAVRPGDKFRVAVSLQVADGYHINAHIPSEDYLVPTTLTLSPPSEIRLSEPVYPAPVERAFEFSPDKKLAVHEGTVIFTADAQATGELKPGEAVIQAQVQVQSCNNSQCLAPAFLKFEIPLKMLAAGAPIKTANQDIFAAAVARVTSTEGVASANRVAAAGGESSSVGSNQIDKLITRYGLPVTLLFVFLFGVALNGTPCVFPIIPITIGFFVNQCKDRDVRFRSTWLMAAIYVLGMAITYSILGVVASLTKGLFGSALQNPLVLIGIASIMIALALSMFGVYEFKLPEFLNRFASSSTQSTSGLLGALMMGLTMGIVAAPCIGPFVLALLLHVEVKGNPLYGLLVFFILALGLGLPYLFLGAFSGAISRLPRSGLWMVTVRKVFGLVILGMALYFLMPLLGKYSTPIVIAFLAACAIYLIAWEAGRTKPKQFAWILRGLGLVAATIAVFSIIAVFSALPKQAESEVAWQPYSEQAVSEATRQGKGVIIDTFADWCIPCRELDQRTFTDADIKKEANKFIMLKLDLTSRDANTEAGRAAQRYDIRGVPTVLFIDPSGKEVPDLRLVSFEKPREFLDRMMKLEAFSGGAGVVEASTTADPGSQLQQLPSDSLKLLDGGSRLDPASEHGKVLLIDFWATWCIPCAKEIPIFNSLNKDYKNKGVEIIGVAMDEEGLSKVKPFVKAHPMDYRIALRSDSTGKSFGVGEVLPITVIADKQGRIRFTHTGLTQEDTFRKEIEQLVNE
jgi:thiol:disulfide interchange protein DsbD